MTSGIDDFTFGGTGEESSREGQGTWPETFDVQAIQNPNPTSNRQGGGSGSGNWFYKALAVNDTVKDPGAKAIMYTVGAIACGLIFVGAGAQGLVWTDKLSKKLKKDSLTELQEIEPIGDDAKGFANFLFGITLACALILFVVLTIVAVFYYKMFAKRVKSPYAG